MDKKQSTPEEGKIKLPQEEIDRRKKLAALREKLCIQRERLNEAAERSFVENHTLINDRVAEEKEVYDQIYERVLREEKRVVSLCDENDDESNQKL